MEHEEAQSGNAPKTNTKLTMLDRLLYRAFSRDLVVVSVEDIAPKLRLITLQSESLRGFSWVPGQKLQVTMGTALVARTYTPIKPDAHTGQFQLIAFAHGLGPGSKWVMTLKPGEMCKVFGPLSSLDLRFEARSLVMVGDETSIGLSVAAAAHYGTIPTHHVFEVHARSNVEAVLDQAGLLPGSTIHVRTSDRSHLIAMEQQVISLAESGADIVLTGRAGTIQKLHRGLCRENIPGKKIHTKAYWAEGKSGLD